jgi:hypothetical protein
MSINLEFQQPISGTINGSGQQIDLTSPNGSTQTVGVTGTWVGVLVVEGSNDGINYYSCTTLNRSTDLVVSTITVNGAYDTNTNAFQFFRVRSSAWTSGTVTIAVYGSNAPSLVFTKSALKGGTDGTTIGNSADSLKVIAGQSGAWTVTAAEDKNYGTVGANTLRGAAQIGNATGAADFNTGATGAQTLRTVANQGAPNTAANAWFTRLTDGTDNSLITPNGDLQTSDILNVSGQYRAQSITTSASEALGGVSILANRKMLSILPTNGTVYWGFSNVVTTVTGTPIYKGQNIVFAIGTNVRVYLIAASTVDCRIAEGS